jgi:hypothetical protein
MVLFGRHASRPTQALLAGAYLFGLGVAGGVAPWLGGQLAGVDPRIPFAMSAAAVVLVTLALLAVEPAPSAPAPPAPTVAISSGRLVTLALAIALLAIGFQVHFFMNTAPAYRRHLEDIDAVMPIFWLGFSLMVLPASALVARFGGLLMMAVASALGAVVVLLGSQADSLAPLIAAHAVAGMAWATVSNGAFAAMSAVARPTGQGSALGILFSMLAAGAIARVTVIATEVVQEPAMTQLLPVLPALAWGAAALVLAGVGWHGTRRSPS